MNRHALGREEYLKLYKNTLHRRLQTLRLHDLCLEVLTVRANNMRLFVADASLLLIQLMSDIVAIGTTFIVFSYDAV